MVSDAKNLFLAGLGAAAMTYDKASEMVNALVKKGKLTMQEGMELSEELKKEIKDTTNQAKDMVSGTIDNMKPLTKDEFNKILEEKNYATKMEILQLKRRIETLEEKQNQM